MDVEVECVEMENRMIESVPKGLGETSWEKSDRRGERERERLEEKQIHSGVSLNYKPTLSTAHTANHLKATQECVQIPPHW